MGVMLTTTVIAVYFCMNDAWKDLIEVYFYNNLFVYAGEKVSVIELVSRTLWTVKKNAGVFGLIAIGFIYMLFNRQWKMFLAIFAEFVCSVILILSAPTVHGYYSMYFSVFAVFGILALWEICKMLKYRFSVNVHKGIIWGSFLFMFLFAYFTGYNTEFMFLEKENLPQYHFAELIDASEETTLLNYGFLDSGFYTAAGIMPTCKYFFEANIDLVEMKEEQKEIAEKGKVDYIVTCDEHYLWNKYQEIANADFKVEGNEVTYYLYQLKDR